MDYERIDQIIEEFKEIEEETGSDFLSVAGQVPLAEITRMEKQASLKFCKVYREFLKRYGAASAFDDRLIGIIPKHPDSQSVGTILYHTKEFEEHAFKLGNKTILNSGDEEFYIIIDHDIGKLFSYDRFSKKYKPYNLSIDDYINKYFEAKLKLAAVCSE